MRAGLPRRRLDQATRPMVPALAPGGAQIFRGRLVIVFGPGGTIGGVFVYQPGTTPGPGNPPIAYMTAGTEDPYGNTVTPQIGSMAGNGQGIVLQGADILFPGSFASAGGEQAAIYGVPATATGKSSFLILASPTDASLLAVMLMAGQTEDLSISPYVQFIQQTQAGVQSAMQVWATGGAVPSQPGTVGSAETWHQATSLGSGWSGSGGGVNGLWYRMSVDGMTDVMFDLSATAAANTTICSIPSAYVTSNFLPRYMQVTLGGKIYQMVIHETGAIEIGSITWSVTDTLCGHIRIPSGAL